MELLSQRSPQVDFFTPAQIRKLLAVATHPWRGMILGGYYTGARIGDLANLQWDQVDLKAGLIRIAQGKTGRAVEVPIHPELASWLNQTPKADRAGRVYPGFAGRTAAGTNGLSGQFRRLLAKAGIEGKTTEKTGEKARNRSSLTFHSLRHSFNSAMANAGVTQEIRQRLTGHASNDAFALPTKRTGR